MAEVEVVADCIPSTNDVHLASWDWALDGDMLFWLHNNICNGAEVFVSWQTCWSGYRDTWVLCAVVA